MQRREESRGRAGDERQGKRSGSQRKEGEGAGRGTMRKMEEMLEGWSGKEENRIREVCGEMKKRTGDARTKKSWWERVEKKWGVEEGKKGCELLKGEWGNGQGIRGGRRGRGKTLITADGYIIIVLWKG